MKDVLQSGDPLQRPTMADVARQAGVGAATVDRVLNERGNVSEEVRRRVLTVARELGLRRKLPPAYRPIIRINLILPRPNLSLLAIMAEEFRAIVRTADRSLQLQVTTLPDEHPATVAGALLSTTSNAVIVYAQDDTRIRDAIDELAGRSIPVVTMISDLPGSKRFAYAGTDHHAAGRTAALFISGMARAPGPVLVVCNHLGFQSHAERVAGFREYLSERASAFEIARVVEGHDDRSRTRALLMAAFEDIGDTLAVYNVGAANLGIRAAIESDALKRRPLFVGHELTVHTAQMLRDGVMTLAIDQNPRVQARFAVDVLLDHFGYEGVPVTSPYVSTVPIVLYTRENIPVGS